MEGPLLFGAWNRRQCRDNVMIYRTGFAVLLALAACSPRGETNVFSSSQNPPAAFCLSEGGSYSPENGGTCTIGSSGPVSAEEFYRERFPE